VPVPFAAPAPLEYNAWLATNTLRAIGNTHNMRRTDECT
jgi:hypothetical protein